jgi:hypothetical protein
MTNYTEDPGKKKENAIQSLVFSTDGKNQKPATCNPSPGTNHLALGR